MIKCLFKIAISFYTCTFKRDYIERMNVSIVKNAFELKLIEHNFKNSF